MHAYCNMALVLNSEVASSTKKNPPPRDWDGVWDQAGPESAEDLMRVSGGCRAYCFIWFVEELCTAL